MEQTVMMVFRSDKNLSAAMKYLMLLILQSSGQTMDNSTKELLFEIMNLSNVYSCVILNLTEVKQKKEGM